MNEKRVLNFAAIKSRFWGILNNIKEELKLRKITRKIKSNKEIRNINKRDRRIKNRSDKSSKKL